MLRFPKALPFLILLVSCARSEEPESSPKSPTTAAGATAAATYQHECAPTASVCRMPRAPGDGAEAAIGARSKGRGGVEGKIAGKATGAPHLVEVGMKGCHACAKMAPVVRDILTKCGASAASLLEHVDVADPEGEEIGRRYGVTKLPTILAVDAKGAEVSRLVGVQKAGAIAQLVAEVTGRACAAPEE